jgi:hypothetical protein
MYNTYVGLWKLLEAMRGPWDEVSECACSVCIKLADRHAEAMQRRLRCRSSHLPAMSRLWGVTAVLLQSWRGTTPAIPCGVTRCTVSGATCIAGFRL